MKIIIGGGRWDGYYRLCRRNVSQMNRIVYCYCKLYLKI